MVERGRRCARHRAAMYSSEFDMARAVTRRSWWHEFHHGRDHGAARPWGLMDDHSIITTAGRASGRSTMRLAAIAALEVMSRGGGLSLHQIHGPRTTDGIMQLGTLRIGEAINPGPAATNHIRRTWATVATALGTVAPRTLLEWSGDGATSPLALDSTWTGLHLSRSR